MKIVKHKQLLIDDELLAICNEIYKENKLDEDWAKIESCDMFQSKRFCGGYSAEEQAFGFSYYDETDKEWWFEITLSSLDRVINGQLQYFDLYDPISQNC